MTGLEIKFARMKAGIKAYELASQVGVNADRISKIETGRLVPNEELLSRIIAAINEAQASSNRPDLLTADALERSSESQRQNSTTR